MQSQTASSPAPADARLQQLHKLLAEEWEYELRESPETATVYGDYRYNDKLTDVSLEHIAQRRRDTGQFLTRFQAIDTAGFPEQERLNQELMVRNLKESLEGYDLKTYEMPVDQFNGIHIVLPQLTSFVPFDSAKHYEDYIARLHQVPVLLDQVVAVLKQGEQDRLMPPRFLLEKVVTQANAIAAPAGMDNAFGQPAQKFPDSISAADQTRLRAAIVATVDDEIRPAYVKFAEYIRKDYAPKGRANPGVWDMPNGDALYRYYVKTQTTTSKAPEEIHELGLKEVHRIEAEQTAIARKLGAKDLQSFRASLRKDRAHFATSREDILDHYRRYVAQMQPRLPQLFGLLPKAQVVVEPVEPFREKEAAAAEYHNGTPDGSRPGKIFVNTGDYQNRSTLSMESTAYHEGVPGHHMQLSIAQELPSLPPFRQHAGYTAYVEGWALYSERLGKEVGFYQDPYSDYGRLSDELLRACRLVLDTGVHSKHWTREQMITFFREHSGEDEPDIQAETDRYIAYPGQALSYKLGQLKFLELRDRAKAQLGASFDIRAFHDEMLNGGALPLDTLDERTSRWLAAQKSGGDKEHSSR